MGGFGPDTSFARDHTLSKVGGADLSWIAAERAMKAADEADDPLVLASAARAATHALSLCQPDHVLAIMRGLNCGDELVGGVRAGADLA